MRGKGRLVGRMHNNQRITPACAGKREAAGSAAIVNRDHPRMCGEKAFCAAVPAVPPGSPPHVRGKGNNHSKRCRDSGITPACAGKSLCRLLNRLLPMDHPRMCGEKLRRRSSPAGNLGSPPHVRGKGTARVPGVSTNGITPACAGKSLWASSDR